MVVSVVALSIPDILREYIDRARLTQGQVAVKARVNPSQVSHWMTGKARPSVENAVAIADMTGRTRREVLEAAGYPADADVPAPDLPAWVTETLAQLDEFELRVVETTARGLLRVREERRAYEAGPPSDPEAEQ